jgi:hypothetical protein
MLLTGLSIPAITDQQGVASWPWIWLMLGALSAAGLGPSSVSVLALASGGAARPSTVSGAKLPVARMAAALLGYFCFSVGYIVYLTFLVAWMRVQGADARLVAATWGVLSLA